MSDKVLLPARPPQVGEMLIFKGVYIAGAIHDAKGRVVTGDGQVRLAGPGDAPSGVIPGCYTEIEARQAFWVCQHGPIEVKAVEPSSFRAAHQYETNGGRVPLQACVNAGLNPEGIPVLLDAVERIVAAMKVAKLETGWEDNTNVLSTLEGALQACKPLTPDA